MSEHPPFYRERDNPDHEVVARIEDLTQRRREREQHKRAQATVEDLQAWRDTIDTRLTQIEHRMAELASRISSIVWLVAGAVLVNLVLRIARF